MAESNDVLAHWILDGFVLPRVQNGFKELQRRKQAEMISKLCSDQFLNSLESLFLSGLLPRLVYFFQF